MFQLTRISLGPYSLSHNVTSESVFRPRESIIIVPSFEDKNWMAEYELVSEDSGEL
ncbi:hypothetical protein ACJMK2_030687, partial [Sinanodonta woodiana]